MYSRRVDLALAIAERLLYKPYFWGGNDPLAGFDCSGLMIEILQSVGVLPRKGDWNAEGLRQLFVNAKTQLPTPGCLVFYGDGSKATHVEMVFDNIGGKLFTIGAMGGGSATKSLQDAIAQDAYVKIRPIREPWLDCVNPFFTA